MSLTYATIFYVRLTKSGAGVTGKAANLPATMKSHTRAVPSVEAALTHGVGGITIDSVREVGGGVYKLAVAGLDPALDYTWTPHYSGTASDVDDVDPVSLRGEFSAGMATTEDEGGPATAADLATAKTEIVAAMPGTIDPRGTGADQCTQIILGEDDAPVADAQVWITSDAEGANVVAGTLITNSSGEVFPLLDDGESYYRWAQKDGMNPIRAQAFTAVKDA
jgi:hypothetical protein